MASTERDYHHPFKPYDIQIQFMSNLYDCLQESQIGIFESPTGTGKSLSLVCGALTWLRDHQKAELEGPPAEIDDDEPAWVVEHDKKERIKRVVAAREELEARLSKARADEQRQRRRYEQGEPPRKRPKGDHQDKTGSENEEAEFLLEDYDSDHGEPDNAKRRQAGSNSNDAFSTETMKLLERAGMLVKPDEEGGDPMQVKTKIFFCSRTHSQLSQFVGEVKRLKFPAAVVAKEDEEPDGQESIESIRLISLGSRKNLCINPKVTKLSSTTAINERCLELQQSATPKDQKCKYLPSKENEPLVTQFRDLALARVRDIEDLGQVGKQTDICPYYASRAAIGPSEIVTLPYPLLLQKSAREALDISLKDHVIVVDEAHNLMDSIEGVYSAEVSLSQLQQSRSQLTAYLQKFRNKLKGMNRVYVAQVVRMINSLSSFLQAKQTSGLKDGLVEMSELMSGKGLDQVNVHKLCRYLQESKLARKVAGYITHAQAAEGADTAKQRPHVATAETPVLMIVEGFFFTLTNPTAEGKYFFESDDGKFLLKYMLLDPAHHFRDVVEESRSVVLAGGTMSPMDDYVHHLFPYVEKSKIRTLSCGHVIPKESLFASPLTGAGLTSFDLTFDKRSSPALLTALGETVVSLAASIPDGLVVFFSSYQYLEQVVRYWKNPVSQESQTLFERIQEKKPVFQEHKGVNVDALLNDYSASISAGDGALLLSVIGGKLSEGINFSDQLGRGVVVVGLPFPNAQSAGWRAKLEYIERSAVARGASSAEGKAAAREFYENSCMRAVNQSIGRAIRHRNDYAAILLLDRRYSTPRIQGKLPGWIKEAMSMGVGNEARMDLLQHKLKAFFEKHEGQRVLVQR